MISYVPRRVLDWFGRNNIISRNLRASGFTWPVGEVDKMPFSIWQDCYCTFEQQLIP